MAREAIFGIVFQEEWIPNVAAVIRAGFKAVYLPVNIEDHLLAQVEVLERHWENMQSDGQ